MYHGGGGIYESHITNINHEKTDLYTHTVVNPLKPGEAYMY